MKKRINDLIILFFLLSINNLQAQGEYIASPQNYAEVQLDIETHYSAGILISSDQIEAHLKFIIKEPTYSLDCTVPVIDGTTQEEDDILLTWEEIPGTSKYTVSYLNLATGKSKSFDTPETQIELKQLPDAMYLISIVGTCGPEGDDDPTSGAYIIVMDKPVLVINDPFVDCPCEKLNLEFQVNAGSLFSPDPLVMNWSPASPWHYLLKISYGGGAGSSFTLATFQNPNAPPAYTFKGQCMSFINYGYSLNANTFFGPGLTGTLFSLHLSSADYAWTLNDPGNMVQTIEMFRCSDRTGGGDDGKRSLDDAEEYMSNGQLFPNPADNRITIRHQSRNGAATQMRVINEVGQVMFEGVLPAYANQQEINVADWPNGRYAVSLWDGEKNYSQSFVKVNQQ